MWGLRRPWAALGKLSSKMVWLKMRGKVAGHEVEHAWSRSGVRSKRRRPVNSPRIASSFGYEQHKGSEAEKEKCCGTSERPFRSDIALSFRHHRGECVVEGSKGAR